MRLACVLVIYGFVALYVIALALFLIGTFGWFGQEPDPLSGVFLIPLGLPWNRLAAGLPDSLLPWVGVLAPPINLGLLAALCRLRNDAAS